MSRKRTTQEKVAWITAGGAVLAAAVGGVLLRGTTPSNSTSQTMVASPGSLQVGGDLNVDARRVLPANVRDEIIARAHHVPPQVVNIATLFGDSEAGLLGEEIGATLQAAGWNVTFSRVIENPTPHGLWLQSRTQPDARVQDVLAPIFDVFGPRGIKLVPSMEEGVLEILVGSK